MDITGKQFLECNVLGVYEWIRGNEWLYVGQSSNCFGRIYSHNIINKIERMQPNDIIRITSFDSISNARVYEENTIKEKQPKYNAWLTNTPVSECLGCGKPITPRMSWEKYCSGNCRRRPKPRNSR